MVDPQVRRRGPRIDIDTRELIVDTAERMFGDTSIAAVSLRAVAREAGVANRAVMYHFPGKRELVAAVARRRSREIFPPMARHLQDLADSDHEVAVRDVVQALLMPHIAQLDADPVGGLRWLKVMTQLALDEDPIWLEEVSGELSLPELFVAAAGKAIPGLQTREGRQRTSLAVFSMIVALASSDLAAYGRPLGPTGLDRAWVEQLIEFTCGGLRGYRT